MTSLRYNMIVKIFIGIQLSHAFRRKIEESKTWKQAQIAWQSRQNQYHYVVFEKKEYLGLYCETEEGVAYHQVLAFEAAIREDLLIHCPTLDIDTAVFKIFPKPFIL